MDETYLYEIDESYVPVQDGRDPDEEWERRLQAHTCEPETVSGRRIQAPVWGRPELLCSPFYNVSQYHLYHAHNITHHIICTNNMYSSKVDNNIMNNVQQRVQHLPRLDITQFFQIFLIMNLSPWFTNTLNIISALSLDCCLVTTNNLPASSLDTVYPPMTVDIQPTLIIPDFR